MPSIFITYNSLRKALSIFLSVSLFVMITGASFAAQEEIDEDISEKMEQVNILRARGEFDDAIEILNGIIRDYSSSDNVSRYAYNHLVFTYHKMGRAGTAIEKAREALDRFPDLRVETPDIPPSVDEIYETLRKEMFGSLTIERPFGCNAYLIQDENKIFKGETPLELPLVRVGTYTLEVTKSGYHDYSRTINVFPDERLNVDVSMSPERGVKWWVLNLSPIALIGAFVAYMAWPSETSTAEPQPLPGPPDPPTQ